MKQREKGGAGVAVARSVPCAASSAAEWECLASRDVVLIWRRRCARSAAEIGAKEGRLEGGKGAGKHPL